MVAKTVSQLLVLVALPSPEPSSASGSSAGLTGVRAGAWQRQQRHKLVNGSWPQTT